MAGSLKYMAPEILTEENTAAEPAIDLFSIGVILYALVIGKLPFEGSDPYQIRRKIVKGIYSYPPTVHLSDEVKDLIDGLLKVNPRKRYTMKQVFHHPWVQPYMKKLSPLLRYGSLSSSFSMDSSEASKLELE